MVDSSLATALVSSVSTLAGTLGGIFLTSRITLGREERQAERQRKDQRKQDRNHAYADLLSAAGQLRLKIKVAALCPWRDMHTRLSAIEKQGGLVNQCAARAALLAPDSVAVAARSLDEEASHLINTGIQLTKMNYDPGSGAFLGGEMEKQPDFKKFDESIQSFERAVADEIGQADQTRN